MPFTDDDLNWLKRNMASAGTWPHWLSYENTKALVTRLEAAETCLEAADREGGIDSHLLKAWRKAAGKNKLNEQP